MTISERVREGMRPEAIEPYDKCWGVGVSGLDEDISPFPRVNRMLEETHKYVAASRIDTQRAIIMTESYEKYKADPQMLRVIKSVRDCIEQVDIHILPDELVVGENCAPAWHAPLYPEFSFDWIVDEMDAMERGEVPDFSERHNDKYIVPEEQRQVIRQIAEKWKGLSVKDRCEATWTEDDVKGQNYVFGSTLYVEQGVGHVSVDYPYLLKVGWKGIKQAIQDNLDAWQEGDDVERRLTWQAQMIAVDAAMTYFRRYGELAAQMAETEQNPQRKKELERISSNCLWVSENPARDFWEAVQLWWGATQLILIESNGHSVTYGRFDQIMGPFYEQDILEGRFTREFMQELIECSFVMMDKLRKLRSFGGAEMASGIGWGGTALNVGGVHPDGTDAVNDVSFMVLDAHAHTRLTNPWMGVKLSVKNPREFWVKTFNVCRIGTGEPKIYNDDKYYESLLAYGVPLEQARNWVGVGCVEPEAPGYTYGWHDSTYYGGAQVLLLAINNGERFDRPGEPFGAPTGYLRDMKSFDEVLEAYDKQNKYWLDRMVSTINTIDLAHQALKPLPYLSLLVHDCVETGTDISRGGARFNFTGTEFVGLGTVTDSLATIKQLIFEEKRITADELIQALKDNWVGHETLQALVNSDYVHHYGNDDDYADQIAEFVMNDYCKHAEHRRNERGGEFRPGVYSVSMNVLLGAFTGATPDGRKDFEPVSDCLGPGHPGGVSHDVKGPLAIAGSLSKLDQSRIANGVILNWKFTPETLDGDAGLDNFMNLFRSYFDRGGLQSQFNVTNKQTLVKAQEKPDNYRNLMVRVAGYSAYFTELSDELQNDLIGRTELSF
ncbi:MAG: pyruvate formate lyase family protein [Coriobacteriales bacterium]|nr:pyruvate formate lyase family protein [Coriobacteriales bacterium]